MSRWRLEPVPVDLRREDDLRHELVLLLAELRELLLVVAHEVQVHRDVHVHPAASEVQPPRPAIERTGRPVEQPGHEHPHQRLHRVVGHGRDGLAHRDAFGEVAVHVQPAGRSRRRLQRLVQRDIGRDRPRLQDPEAVAGISPFHVHRFAVQRLDALDRVLEFRDAIPAQARFVRPVAALVAQTLFDDLAGHRVDDRRVRGDLALYQRFPKTPARVDEHLVEVVGQRVEREGDARDLAVHEFLHDHGDLRIEVLETRLPLIDQYPRVEAGAEATAHGVVEGFRIRAEHRLVESRERRARQVLLRRRRAYGAAGCAALGSDPIEHRTLLRGERQRTTEALETGPNAIQLRTLRLHDRRPLRGRADPRQPRFEKRRGEHAPGRDLEPRLAQPDQGRGLATDFREVWRLRGSQGNHQGHVAACHGSSLRLQRTRASAASRTRTYAPAASCRTKIGSSVAPGSYPSSRNATLRSLNVPVTSDSDCSRRKTGTA